MNHFSLLSFLLLFVVVLSCNKVQDIMEEQGITEIEVLRMPKDSHHLAVFEIYMDLPDSVLAEIELMDSLISETNYIDDFEEDYNQTALFEAQVKALDTVDVSQWKNLKAGSFKRHQTSFQKVQEVYASNEEMVKKLLVSKGIYSFELDFYMRAFKDEGAMELWAKSKDKAEYQHLVTYPFYQGASQLGPKHREGDLQVPEGYYYIDYFNPESSYKVSLRVNYPNKADQIRNAKEKDIGGAICIHGHYVSVGCLAMTDLRIPNIYILAVEAKDRGQLEVPIHIYPTRLTEKKLAKLEAEFAPKTAYLKLWKSMQAGYDYFELNRELPPIQVTETGMYALVEP